MLNRRLTKYIALILTFSILNVTAGCVVRYNTKVVPTHQPDQALRRPVIIIQQGEKIVKIRDARLDEDQIYGYYTSKRTTKWNHRFEGRIWVTDDASLSPDIDGKISVSLEHIERIEVYDVNIGKTILFSTGLVVGSFAALTLIYNLFFRGPTPPRSCPSVYVYNGEEYVFTGEIYSGATFPPVERHDYLPLPGISEAEGTYRLKIANEDPEIDHTNLAELMVFDHPENTDVLVDKYGQVHTIKEPVAPETAVNLDDIPVDELIRSKDDTYYVGYDYSGDRIWDGVVLSFPRPDNADTAKLILRAKNSMWLDYAYSHFLDRFGDVYTVWYEEQKKAPVSEMEQWQREQGIVLSVYVERHGEWEYADSFNVIGPKAGKDVVLPVDLTGVDAGRVRVKLEGGILFWEIDYAAMDFTPDEPVVQKRVQLESAVDQHGEDVANRLLTDDGLYYDQPRIGDEAVLSFVVPLEAPGLERTVILHTKGYYEIIKDPSGKPDMAFLYSMEEPGAFTRYSKEYFQELVSTLYKKEFDYDKEVLD